MNHNHVTRSAEYLDAVHAASERLHELYEMGRKPNDTKGRDRIGQQIAETHQSLGRGMKLAEVHALLGIADAINALNPRLPNGDRAVTL